MKPPKIDVQKLKPKHLRKKGASNAGRDNNACPHCLSTLKVDRHGNWECTGDRLKMWVVEFEKYDDMTELNKLKYSNTLSNEDKFLTLFTKWKSGDLVCEYSSNFVNVYSKQKYQIPDPMLVGRLERNLGRELTDAEKLGDQPIYKVNNKYTSIYAPGAEIIEIPMVSFPEDL